MDLRVGIFFALISLIHCDKPKHEGFYKIFSLYWVPFLGIVINLSCEQIRKFVDGHNSRRLQLARGDVPNQPAASNMKYMIWDAELASKAEKWASRNQFQHNPDQSVPSGRFTTGENLWMSWTSNFNAKVDPDSSLQSWFQEHKDYTYGPLSASDFSNPSKQVGHYTQMAWANTIYVGCAISQFKSNNMNTFFVVCNYGPAGNYLGQTPYTKGAKGNRRLTCGSNSCTSNLYGNKC